jgi:hypothetical protein
MDWKHEPCCADAPVIRWGFIRSGAGAHATDRCHVNKSNSEVSMSRREKRELRRIALKRLAEPVIRSVVEKHLQRWQHSHVKQAA